MTARTAYGLDTPRGSSVRIPLSDGRHAIVDSGDAPLVLPYRWHARKPGSVWYAATSVRRPDGTWVDEFMHRLLTAGAWDEVDHRNGDGLDNRRSNLRPASHAQNAYNTGKKRIAGATSQFKGVSFDRHRGTWKALIRIGDGRRLWLGRFRDERLAAEAYDAAARVHHGEFAALNFPGPGERGAR